jgi:hypothetical protein
MQINQDRRAFAILAMISISICGALVYVFNAGFDESRYFSRHSFDYYLLVQSKYVKNFPIPNGAVDVTYHSSCGDGPKPPSTTVQIDNVSEIEQSYLNEIEKFVSDFGLERKRSDDGGMGPFRGLSAHYEEEKHDSIELTMRRETSGFYSIALEHIEYQ